MLDQEDGTVKNHREGKIYKRLLEETQFEQLSVTRKYQKLVTEKESEVQRLRARCTSAGAQMTPCKRGRRNASEGREENLN